MPGTIGVAREGRRAHDPLFPRKVFQYEKNIRVFRKHRHVLGGSNGRDDLTGALFIFSHPCIAGPLPIKNSGHATTRKSERFTFLTCNCITVIHKSSLQHFSSTVINFLRCLCKRPCYAASIRKLRYTHGDEKWLNFCCVTWLWRFTIKNVKFSPWWTTFFLLFFFVIASHFGVINLVKPHFFKISNCRERSVGFDFMQTGFHAGSFEFLLQQDCDVSRLGTGDRKKKIKRSHIYKEPASSPFKIDKTYLQNYVLQRLTTFEFTFCI